MEAERVTVEIGPVPAALAREWAEHCRELLEAVRKHGGTISIEFDELMIDLLDSVLSVWHAVANDETFYWRFDTTAELLTKVVDQWLTIGSMTDEDLAEIGVGWAPSETRPMSDAIVAGVARALDELGEEAGELRRRLGL